MGPQEHLEKIVRPNLSDLQANFADLRHAFNAVAAVDAFAGHLYWWSRSHASHEVRGIENDSAYRYRLAQANKDFRLVRDIAKAQKHVRLIQGSPEVSAAAQIENRTLGWGQATWGEGLWNGPPQVVVETNVGEFCVLEPILVRALEFLEGEMARLGAASTPSQSTDDLS